MQSRFQSLMRVATIVLVVAILVMVGLLVRHVITSDNTPRTELERAVVAAEEAVRADPEDPSARVKLAAAYLESGAMAAAQEQGEIAVRLDPNDPSAYYVLGLVYLKRGDTEAAIEQLTTAVETEGQLAGFYQDAWAALAEAYDQDGQPERAIEAMDQSINMGPENAQYLVRRAELYERQEMWADALADYVFAITYVPDYEPAIEGIERIRSEHPEAVDEAREKFEIMVPGSEEATTAPAE